MTSAAPRYLAAASSDPGLVRENNEDRVYCDEARGFFLVVDGIGGHQAGEQAADIAVERIRARLERATDSIEQRVREAIALANNAIYKAALGRPDWHGMACVLTVAVIHNGQATVGHVGDSRLYKVRRGHIEKITHDHSPVGEREDRGEVSEAEAMRDPRRNEVFRDVGSEEHTPDDEDFIEIRTIPFETHSALLLCTDGLSDVLASGEILRIIEEHAADPRAAVDALIEAANRNSKDNVSAILIEGAGFASSVAGASATASAEGGRRWPVREFLLMLGGALLGLIPFAIHQWRHAPPPRSPQVLQVGGQGSPTISIALEQARPGDTVEIAPGEYPEQVLLREGVTLIALKPREAVIRPPIPAPDAIGMIADSIRGARVIGVKVTGAGVAVRSSDVSLERIEVTGAGGAGVEYSGPSRGLLQASYVHHNAGPGVVIQDPAAPALENNVIIQNGKGARPLPGAEIRSLAHPILLGNTIADNGAEPVWQVGPAAPSLLERNFFSIDPKTPVKRKVRVLAPSEAGR